MELAAESPRMGRTASEEPRRDGQTKCRPRTLWPSGAATVGKEAMKLGNILEVQRLVD